MAVVPRRWRAEPTERVKKGRQEMMCAHEKAPRFEGLPRSGGLAGVGPGDDRLSRVSTIMGPAGLTAVFGMGTGVAPPAWSPGIRDAGGQARAPRIRESVTAGGRSSRTGPGGGCDAISWLSRGHSPERFRRSRGL